MIPKSNLNSLTKNTTPPAKGTLERTPNVADDPEPAPPLVEAASKSGKWPVHDAPGASERRRS